MTGPAPCAVRTRSVCSRRGPTARGRRRGTPWAGGGLRCGGPAVRRLRHGETESAGRGRFDSGAEAAGEGAQGRVATVRRDHRARPAVAGGNGRRPASLVLVVHVQRDVRAVPASTEGYPLGRGMRGGGRRVGRSKKVLMQHLCVGGPLPEPVRPWTTGLTVVRRCDVCRHAHGNHLAVLLCDCSAPHGGRDRVGRRAEAA